MTTTTGPVQGVVNNNAAEEANVEGEDVRVATRRAQKSADGDSECSTAVSMVPGRHCNLCEVKYEVACRQARELDMPGSYTYVGGVFVDLRPWERTRLKAQLKMRQAQDSRHLNPHGSHARSNGVFVDLYPCRACYQACDAVTGGQLRAGESRG